MSSRIPSKPRILGYRKNGCPIWSIAGASPDGDPPQQPPQGDPPQQPTPPEPKGDEQKPAGEKPSGEQSPWSDPAAAEKEIRKLRDENAKRRTWERDNAPKLSEYEKLLESQKSEEQKRAEQLEAATQTNATLTKALARSQVMLRASDAFADPSDAADALDLASFVNGGEVDMTSVDKALKDLLERKPHWAKQSDQRPGPRPDPSQGRKGSENGNIEEQIAQATRDGNINLAISLRNRSLFAEMQKNHATR